LSDISWSEGYVSDVAYTYGYYPQLNPANAKLVFAFAGIDFSDQIATACELGFGQGITLNIHAAASSVQWFGTDFNPEHAAFAQKIASVAGSEARIYEDSFADFYARKDLPNFDFIGLHGIWSWISQENKINIINFLKEKLNPGGVVYISYNTMPGWASFAPVRRLMAEFGDAMSAGGDSTIKQFKDALNFSDEVFNLAAGFKAANPSAEIRLKSLKKQSTSYLVHEYMNQSWEPTYFSDVADKLSAAKLSYACSADCLSQIDDVNFSPDQAKFINGIENRNFKESVRDLMLNRQFRSDYWVRGARRLNFLEHLEAIRSQQIVMPFERSSINPKFKSLRGEITMDPRVYDPLLEVLSDNKTISIGDLEVKVKKSNLTFSEISQALMVLFGQNYIFPVLADSNYQARLERSKKFNHYVVQRATLSRNVSYLISPVTGGGFDVGWLGLLMLNAMSGGLKQPSQIASFVLAQLDRSGEKLTKNGSILVDNTEISKELTESAIEFTSKKLKVLHNLHIFTQ
jgi:SAM-dependent methyltransferase